MIDNQELHEFQKKKILQKTEEYVNNNILIENKHFHGDDLNNFLKISSSKLILRNCTFTGKRFNTKTYNNALQALDSIVVLDSCTFTHFFGSVLHFTNCIVKIKDTHIEHNKIDYNMLTDKFNTIKGGCCIYSKKSSIKIYGRSVISNNSSLSYDCFKCIHGGAMSIIESEIEVSGDVEIYNNKSYGRWSIGSVLYAIKSNIILKDRIHIFKNIGEKSVFVFKECNFILMNNVKIYNNISNTSGIFNLIRSKSIISDDVLIEGNKTITSGAVTIEEESSKLLIKDNVVFKNNIIEYNLEKNYAYRCGAAITVNIFDSDNTIIIKDNVKFIKNNNKNGNGGAISFGSRFKNRYPECNIQIYGNVLFEDNIAEMGGAIYTKFNLIIKGDIKFINNQTLLCNNHDIYTEKIKEITIKISEECRDNCKIAYHDSEEINQNIVII